MLRDELVKWCESHNFKITPSKKKKPKKNKYSENSFAEMMGMNRPIYRRSRGGSFRQR